MARKFLTPIDLTKLEIQNVALQNLGSDPGTPATGQIYFNTGGTVKVYNGSAWLTLSTSVGTVTSVTGTSPVVSSGGTTPAISLATGYGDTLNPYATKTNNYVLAGAASGGSTTPTFRALVAADIPTTLNGTTFSGAVAMGTNRITGLGEPSGAQDAVTKSYVDNISKGLNAHEAVAYATTGALGTAGNLVGGTITTTYANGTAGVGATITVATSSNWTAITIDGQSLTVTDRVLIKNQSSNVQNGIYTVTSVGAVGNTTSFVFTRALDIDEELELSSGDLTYVIAGTANGGNGYVLTTPVTIVGTSPVVWSQFSGSSSTLAGAGLVTNGSNPNQVDVGAGTGITVNSDSVAIDTAVVPRLTSANAFTVGGQTITNDAVGTVPLLIKGASGQTANLLDIQNSASTSVSGFGNTGNLRVRTATEFSAALNLAAAASTQIGAVIRGATSQTANLTEWQDNSGTVLAQITTGGQYVSPQRVTIGLTALSTAAQLVVNSPVDRVTIIARGVASQTENLQEWQNSAGSTRAQVTADGSILTSATLTTTQNLRVGGLAANGGGLGIIGISNATTVPTSNPTGGGVLYVDGGALKYRGTSGSAATIVNADGTSPGIKKAASTVVLTANTQATINHALGTQAVVVQMFDSSWNLVDMDVLNFDANNVKVTSQTAGTYNYVIIG